MFTPTKSLPDYVFCTCVLTSVRTSSRRNIFLNRSFGDLSLTCTPILSIREILKGWKHQIVQETLNFYGKHFLEWQGSQRTEKVPFASAKATLDEFSCIRLNGAKHLYWLKHSYEWHISQHISVLELESSKNVKEELPNGSHSLTILTLGYM